MMMKVQVVYANGQYHMTDNVAPDKGVSINRLDWMIFQDFLKANQDWQDWMAGLYRCQASREEVS